MELELNILSNGMNGEGIAKYNGKIFFVDGGVEGDLLTAKIVKENKNFCKAQMVNIISPSHYRCEPICKYYGICGGCDLQHINYQQQLKIKMQNVQNLLDKSKINYTIKDCFCSVLEYGYRNKLTLYFNNNQLCFYQKNSHNIVGINNCKLVDENFNNLINKLNSFFKQNKDYNSFILKGLSIRKIENNYIINLILTKKINSTKLQNYLKLNKINYSLYYCINDKNNSNIPQYPCYFVGGINQIYSCEYGIKYPIYPMSFLQVNNDVKHLVYDKILAEIKDYNCVLDAYSGAGLLSAILAKNNKNVYAVEIDQSASKSCQELCKQNGIDNVCSICGDCKIEIPKILNGNKIDCVVLDPARAGVDCKILQELTKDNVDKIVYLSCNPATLARDLKILIDGGYDIDYVGVYDMFPQTVNIETLVVLKYGKR